MKQTGGYGARLTVDPNPSHPLLMQAVRRLLKGKIMKQKVLRAKQSPLNKLQWDCDLACGHSEWVTAKRKPRTVECHAEHGVQRTAGGPKEIAVGFVNKMLEGNGGE